MNTNRDLTNEIGFIYKITAPFGAVYIGQTVCSKKRKYQYKKGAFTKQTKLWNSSQKYDWNPSEFFEVIEECICGEDKYLINEREIYWISHFDSYNNGLNCTEGGKGQLGRKWSKEQKENQSKLITEMYKRGEIPIVIYSGHNLTEEHKDKIRLSNIGKSGWNKGLKTSNEVKEKISKSTLGENNHFYGKTHTDEVRLKMSESHTGSKLSEETKKKMSESQLKRDKSNDRKHTVSVFQYDMENNFIARYNSIKEAAEKTNSKTSGIIRVCKNGRKSTNNFIWKYEILS